MPSSPRRFRPRPIAAPQGGHAPQHRTAAVFVDRAKTLNTADYDKIILQMRRLPARNHTAHWPAAFLNNGSAMFEAGKPTSSPRPPQEERREEQR
ncbi:hypothetical protein TcBrA4_0084730 [Trypanosoma cruzi]|nr:hypothetical protein TcBrA4_0084730 [Trypanosoma cruzi]